MAELNEVIQTKKSEAETFVSALSEIQIKSDDEREQVRNAGIEAKRREKKLTDERFGWTRPIDEQKKRVMEFFQPIIDKYKTFASACTNKVVEWDQKQARKEAERRRIVEEQARKEREKAERAAMKQKEKEEQERQKAVKLQMEAQKATDAAEQAKLFADAAKAAQKADKAAIKAYENETKAEEAEALPPVQTVERKGVHTRSRFKAVVMDKEKFIDHAVETNQLYYLEIADKILTKEANATSGQKSWPGIKIDRITKGIMRTK